MVGSAFIHPSSGNCQELWQDRGECQMHSCRITEALALVKQRNIPTKITQINMRLQAGSTQGV